MKGDIRYGWFVMGNRSRTCRTVVAWVYRVTRIKLLYPPVTGAGLDRVTVQPLCGYACSHIRAATIQVISKITLLPLPRKWQ